MSLSDSISDTHAFQVTAACYCIGHYRECHTQKKYALRKPVRLVRIQNPLQQEPASCKQSTSVSKIKWQLLEFFSFVIVLVFVRSARCNFYFYIVFVSQIVIILVFVLIERSVIILVFVFVTKIALGTTQHSWQLNSSLFANSIFCNLQCHVFFFWKAFNKCPSL